MEAPFSISLKFSEGNNFPFRQFTGRTGMMPTLYRIALPMPDPALSGPALPPTLPAAERIREEERARIARDLHDELGAYLTGLRMTLGQLREALAQPDTRPVQQEHARYAEQLVLDAGAAMHRLIDDLHPPVIEFGLAEALAHLARQFARQTGLACDLHCASDIAPLDRFTVLTLYRLAQEALNNVAQHAQARQAQRSVILEEQWLALRVTDDGRGFDAGIADMPRTRAGAGGNGLLNLRQRVQSLCGSLHIDSAPGRGTVIIARVPVAH